MKNASSVSNSYWNMDIDNIFAIYCSEISVNISVHVLHTDSHLDLILTLTRPSDVLWLYIWPCSPAGR